MRRLGMIVLASAVILMLLACLAFADEGKEATKDTKEVKHEYVGAKKCKICHKKDGIHESWAATKHATAFDSLSAEDQKNKDLLPFYTTGTTAKGVTLTGIQCEACHGPGADYKKKKIMQDREMAVKNGLLIPDEKACLKCHNEKAPAALAATAKVFDFAKMKEKGVHAAAKKAAKAKK